MVTGGAGEARVIINCARMSANPEGPMRWMLLAMGVLTMAGTARRADAQDRMPLRAPRLKLRIFNPTRYFPVSGLRVR